MNIQVGDIVLENKPLNNVEIEDSAKKLKIKNFRGCFLRDTLPKKPKAHECGIFNLDQKGGGGTHWVAWNKTKNKKYYFDSYGLPPPLEIIKYLESPLYFSTERLQPDGEVFCGHLCLYILSELGKNKKSIQEIINDIT